MLDKEEEGWQDDKKRDRTADSNERTDIKPDSILIPTDKHPPQKNLHKIIKTHQASMIQQNTLS